MAQFNKSTQDFLNQERTLFEVPMIANKNGDVVSETNRFPVGIGTTGEVSINYNGTSVSFENPFPVSLGSSNITITGDVNVLDSITVNNTKSQGVPIQNDNSGPLVVAGIVTVQDGGGSINVDGTVSAAQTGAWTVEVNNDSGNPLPIVGIVTVQDGGGSITVDGTVSAAQTGAWTVEVNNDSGNPLPISKNTTLNSAVNPIYIEAANVASTSKDRQKITTYSTGFFSTFQHNKSTDFWDESVSIGGTVTWDQNWAAVRLDVTSTPGSKVIRQTRNVMRYVPGRPAEFSMSYFWGTPIAGIRKRHGMFDENNGFYLEQDETGEYYCVLRSKTTGVVLENRVARSSWNGDKLLGNGPSGITLDKSKSQLIVVDYEWYGVGTVKFSFVIDGKTIDAHTFYNANTIATPWCSTPFLPMRIELENISASSGDYLYHSSSCHSQEGSSDNLGTPLSIPTPLGGRTLATANIYYPVLAIRLKSTALNAIIIPQYMQAGTLDNTFVQYRLNLNPTLTGASWVDHPSSDSSVQYDISSTATTGGIIINNGFAASGFNDRLPLNGNQASGNFQLGRVGLGTVSDVLSIEVAAANGSNKAAIAVINWIEQR